MTRRAESVTFEALALYRRILMYYVQLIYTRYYIIHFSYHYTTHLLLSTVTMSIITNARRRASRYAQRPESIVRWYIVYTYKNRS